MSQRPGGDHERLLPTPDEEARIDALLGDTDRPPGEVEWREPGPDPFGQGWRWMHGPESGDLRGMDRDAPGDDESSGIAATIPLSPGRDASPRRPGRFWPASAAASLLVIALGTWAFVARGRGPIREEDVTAWVTQRLEPGEGGIRIAAPAGGDEQAEEPLIGHIDRPLDAAPTAAPNVYAPLRLQEQLVVPEVPPSVTPGIPTDRPLRTVVETVRPGSLFYLEFTTASTPSPGTAVVVRAGREPWRPLWEEVAVSPSDGTCYFGPLEMGEGGASYLVVLADRTGTPLLTTVARTLESPSGPDAWKTRLAAALEEAGHAWYGIQRIEARPEPGDVPGR